MKWKQTSLRFTEEEMAEMKKLAKKESRPLSNWMRFAIQKYIEQQSIKEAA